MHTNADIYVALLQVCSTSLGQGLSSPATVVFNCPIRGIMPIINRPPIKADNAD